jgi:uncharacterized protein with HEPN domain
MEHDDRIYLAHMLESARKAYARVAGRTAEQFDANEDLRLAVTHLIQTIGEAARQVSEATRLRHPAIPWKEVIGMRNVIVHDYLGVDDQIVWKVATADLPNLIAALEAAQEDRL